MKFVRHAGKPMKLDNFTAWIQAILSIMYLLFTFGVIVIYELVALGIIATSRVPTAGEEKTFDSMVSWMTGGALIVLYFWLQRAKAVSPPDPAQTTTKTLIETNTTPTGDPNATSEKSTLVDDHSGSAGER